MNAKIAIVLSLIVILIVIKVSTYAYEIEYVRSNVDDNTYLVRNLNDANIASDTLARLRKDLIEFITYLHNNESSNTSDKMKQKIDKLYYEVLPILQPENISESTPTEKYTSYTINKTKLYFCLRQKDGTDKFVDYNIVMFVALHELTHMMNDEYDPDHENGFWEDMSYLLQKAIDNGIYVYQPYDKLPVKYCGIVIDNTPLHM